MDKQIDSVGQLPTNKNHYLLLDAVRGLAALAVFLYHLKTFVYPDTELGHAHYFSKSYLAVDLFFLMSGLVIARSYEDRLLSNIMTFKEFFWVRLLRLYPLYIAGLGLGIGYVLFRWLIKHEYSGSPSELTLSLILNAFFIPDFSNNKGMFAFDPAAWSLSLEWIINIIYAAIAVKFSTRFLCAVAGIGALLLVASGIYAGSLDLGWASENFSGGFVRILYSFTVGVLIYRLMKKYEVPIKLNALLLLLPVLCVLVIPMPENTIYFDLTLAILGFPLFVYFACTSHVSGFFKRSFSLSGQISYSLYILHTPLIMWVAGAWKLITKTDPQDDAVISFALITIIILIISYLATICFDEPVRAYFKKFLKKS